MFIGMLLSTLPLSPSRSVYGREMVANIDQDPKSRD
jgi:hypothetical protein